MGAENALLTPHLLYTGLGQETGERQRAYRELFKAHLEDKMIEDIRKATNGNFALGNKKFKEEVERMLKRRSRPGKSGRPRREVDDGQRNPF